VNVLSVFLCIGGCEPSSGKTIVALAIALKLRELGYKVSYLKPIGQNITTTEDGSLVDEDAKLAVSVLELPLKPQELTPILYHEDLTLKFMFKGLSEEAKAKIQAAAKAASKDADVTIVEGMSRIFDGMSTGASILDICKELGGKLLQISFYEPQYVGDKLLLAKSLADKYGVKMIGAVVTGVDEALIPRFEWEVLPLIEQGGIKVVGIVPLLRELTPLTAGEIASILNAEVIAARDHLDNVVKELLVGAWTVEKAMRYLRRAMDYALVTGGDRTDLLLAALETPVSCLILTGGFYPDQHVLTRAEEKGVPVVLSRFDTLTTTRRIDELAFRLDPSNIGRIKRIASSVSRRIDINAILESLSLQG